METDIINENNISQRNSRINSPRKDSFPEEVYIPEFDILTRPQFTSRNQIYPQVGNSGWDEEEEEEKMSFSNSQDDSSGCSDYGDLIIADNEVDLGGHNYFSSYDGIPAHLQNSNSKLTSRRGKQKKRRRRKDREEPELCAEISKPSKYLKLFENSRS